MNVFGDFVCRLLFVKGHVERHEYHSITLFLAFGSRMAYKRYGHQFTENNGGAPRSILEALINMSEASVSLNE